MLRIKMLCLKGHGWKKRIKNFLWEIFLFETYTGNEFKFHREREVFKKA